MSRKQNSLMRFSRTERLAQLSEQEVVIERKKREIQAKIEAQKKKENEEAFRKLEASTDEKKNNDLNYYSKKNSWKRDGADKDNEKFIELDKQDSLKNAFSNDGSFLDHFKKMSQSNFPLNKTNTEKEIGKNKDFGAANDFRRSEDKERESVCARKTLDPNIQLQLPPPGVMQSVTQQQMMPMIQPLNQNSMPLVASTLPQVSTMQSTVSNSVPQFITNEIQLKAISSPSFSQSAQTVHSTSLSASSAASVEKKIETEKNSNLSNFKKTSSVHQSFSTAAQNKHLPSSSQKKSELISRGHTECVSLTFKNNATKKLESIANPLGDDDDDVPERKTSKKNIHLKFEEAKRKNLLDLHRNLGLLQNPFSSQNEEFSKISPAFYDGEQEFGGKEWKRRIENTAKAVAQCGDELEEVLRKCNENEPTMGFLQEKNVREYAIFREKVRQFREENCKEKKLDCDKEKSDNKETNIEKKADNKSDSFSSKTQMEEDSLSKSNDGYQGDNEEESGSNKISERKKDQKIENSVTNPDEANTEQLKVGERHKRKRKSRWGDMATSTQPALVTSNLNIQLGKLPAPKTNLLSQLTRSDPGLIQYAKQTFGSTNLSEEDWKKAEDHYKINLLYQDLIKKRAEIKKLEKAGKFKYEYDSDEDVEGGTWEHKLRQQEMMATQLWAEELTRQAAGKHHIGDFLPPEELERFMEKYNAVKEGREPDLSDYKEFKLKEDNVGYRLLQKMGWNEGQGLGQDGSGMTHPVNKAATRHENQGLGLERPDGLEAGDDEYDAYRKRMMLAYRFRPNPLNNPRRPYY